VIRIPLPAFDRLDYAAWCTLRICPDDFPASCFECLTETAGYARGVDRVSATRAEIRLVTPAASSRAAQERNAAMSVPPVAGTVIEHLTGRVIWVSKPSVANWRNPQNLTQRRV
jgi:hypothetical protein